MNPLYYSTSEEVRACVDFLNQHSIGGGVATLKTLDFQGPFVVPEVAGKQIMQAVLVCGESVNCGLVNDLRKKYPEWLVVAQLQAGVTPRKED